MMWRDTLWMCSTCTTSSWAGSSIVYCSIDSGPNANIYSPNWITMSAGCVRISWRFPYACLSNARDSTYRAIPKWMFESVARLHAATRYLSYVHTECRRVAVCKRMCWAELDAWAGAFFGNKNTGRYGWCRMIGAGLYRKAGRRELSGDDWLTIRAPPAESRRLIQI